MYTSNYNQKQYYFFVPVCFFKKKQIAEHVFVINNDITLIFKARIKID